MLFRRLRERLSLTARLTAVNLGGLVLLGTVSYVLTLTVVYREMVKHGVEAQGASLKLMERLASDVGPAHLVGGELYLGEHRVREDFHLVDAVAEGTMGVATIFQGDERISTNVRTAEGTRAVGTRLARNAAWEAIFQQDRAFTGEVDILGEPYFTGYQPLRDPAGKTIGILFVGVKKAEYLRVVYTLGLVGLLVGGVALTVLLGANLWAVRRQLRPLQEVAAALRRTHAGQLDEVVPHAERRDEIGAMAMAITDFQRASREKRQAEAEAAAAHAETAAAEARAAQARAADEAHARAAAQEAERRRREEEERVREAEARRQTERAAEAAAAERRRAEELARIETDFERAVASTVASISFEVLDLREAARGLATAVADLRTRTAAASLASVHTATNVEAAAGALGELAGSVDQVGRRAADSADITRHAAADSEVATRRNAELAQQSERIGQVVRLIAQVASQTHLIALNASIEAARAGEAGKGFAVVAGEVKSLATQVTRATTEIGTQITAVRGASEQAVVSMREIARTMGRVDEHAGAISEAVRSQASATAGIADNLRGTSRLTAEIQATLAELDRITASADQQAGQAAATAELVMGHADELSQATAAFLARLKVDREGSAAA